MTNRIQTSWSSIAPGATVVAITKTFPFDAVATAHAMGLRHIGENRVEEAGGKILEAKEKRFTDIIWHMVGHVQSRKAAEVAALFDCVDSVDSIEILKKLDTAAVAAKKKLHILFELNISGEASKYGFDLVDWEHNPQKLQLLYKVIHMGLQLPGVVLDGCMTMAPYVTEAEKNRPIFRSMKKLSETIRMQIPTFGQQLSMGTSCDYAVALQEGATQIRLGEVLFGERSVAKKHAKQV